MKKRTNANQIKKSLTGVQGLDEVTQGGLPRGRATLICGNAGNGKTLLAVEFVVRGATQFNEAGVIVTFDESTKEMVENVASLGFDLNQLIRQKKLLIEHIQIDPHDFAEAGVYDLEGLFIRIGQAIDAVGAKRVALDTLEVLFASLPNTAILRRELQRLLRWFKDKGVTVVVTGESGKGTLTRHGVEEYISDCVIFLDHRVNEQISTRRLRVVKYRGSQHGTNEYPFLINDDGLSIIPITSNELQNVAPQSRLSSGIPELDQMLSGKGFYRGSTILLTGVTGTGKSSFAAHFVNAACLRKEKTLYLSFEESQHQIIRNMRSIGIDLGKHQKAGLLQFLANRPSRFGLERHLLMINQFVAKFEARNIVMDPLNSFVSGENKVEVEEMLIRLIDDLKAKGITCYMTNLTHSSSSDYHDVTLSSLVDTWIQLRRVETQNRNAYQIFVVKSRGMAHSGNIHEYQITSKGIKIT